MIYLDLLWRFGLISLIAFGGGQAALPLVERTAVHDAHWITSAMFGTAIALGYLTPGPVLIVATFVGYQVAGIAGALVATVGAFVAPWSLAAILAQQLGRYAQHPILRRFGRAAAPAVIALLGVTILDLGREALLGSWAHVVIAAAVLALAAGTRVNPAALLVLGWCARLLLLKLRHYRPAARLDTCASHRYGARTLFSSLSSGGIPMRRTPFLLALALIAAACASMPSSDQGLVSRAVQAQGGADALGAVKTLTVKGTLRQWEPEQSAKAGGEMRLANDSTFDLVADVGAGATRTDWVKKFAYPAPRTFTFTEIVTPEAGYVAGIDSNGRNKQSLESNPPAHSMSGLRLAAAQRELRRASPLLALEMSRNPGRVSPVPDVTVGSASYPAVAYRVGDQTLTVMFDRATGLPARIRTLDYDNIWGDVTFDVVLSDWKPAGSIRVPMALKYELNGRPVSEVTLSEVVVNAPVAADRLAIPDAVKAGAAKPAAGAVPYQWVLRRQFIGTYLDSEAPSYDARATSGQRLVELGPGVQHAVGGSHNSLIVELKDYLIVFDAPVSDAQSRWTIAAAKAKFPGKPVKYLVLTHHHMDHAGGLRAYAAEGATLVVGAGTADHYRRVLAAPATRNPDLPARDLTKTEIVEVADTRLFSDGARAVQVFVIDGNPHADGLLIGYIPELKLGFVTDIWTPGPPLPDKLNPNLASLVAGVKKAGIAPAKFAGGHGGVADYAPLAALEGK